MALVIMPLKTLMQDQVKRWQSCGVQITAILPMSEMSETDKKGNDFVSDQPASFSHLTTIAYWLRGIICSVQQPITMTYIFVLTFERTTLLKYQWKNITFHIFVSNYK